MSDNEYKLRARKMVDEVGRKFAWPGGYPLVLAMSDGGSLCPDCVVKERDLITEADPGSGWHAEGAYIHWEGPPEICDHCGASVESAYG